MLKGFESVEKIQNGGLYHPDHFKDNCGFGLIAQLSGEASHALLRTAVESGWAVPRCFWPSRIRRKKNFGILFLGQNPIRIHNFRGS